jgi:hypothetical protein
VLIVFSGDPRPYAFRPEELTVVGRGLNEGDWVQVIDRKDEYNGMVGVVTEIGGKDDGYAVYVWSEDHSDIYVFRRHQLKAAPFGAMAERQHKTAAAGAPDSGEIVDKKPN